VKKSSREKAYFLLSIVIFDLIYCLYNTTRRNILDTLIMGLNDHPLHGEERAERPSEGKVY
jgi:hypothetical protein